MERKTAQQTEKRHESLQTKIMKDGCCPESVCMLSVTSLIGRTEKNYQTLVIRAFGKNESRMDRKPTVWLLLRVLFAIMLRTTLLSVSRSLRVSGLARVSVAGYHERVIDHYERPRNVGSLPKEDPNVGTGLVGAPACGDVMKLQLRLGKIISRCHGK